MNDFRNPICAISYLSRLGSTRFLAISAIAFLFLAGISTSHGFTANDSSKTVLSDGSVSDTQAAVNYVAGKSQDNWVLTVGSAGASYTWASALNVNIPKIFTIRGASASNRPTITSTTTAGFGISVSCTNTKTITIKDLKFGGWSASNAMFGLSGAGVDCFRITNIQFPGAIKFAFWTSGIGQGGGEGPYGVIDNCTWPNGGGVGFFRDNPGSNPNSWHRAMSWGTKKAVYIEDCTMTSTNPPQWSGALDGDNGARIVYRHNTIKNAIAHVHGADSGGPINSALQVEMMHNTFTVDQGSDCVFFLRGGSALFFDNTINRTGGGFYNFVVKQKFYRGTSCEGVCSVDYTYPGHYIGPQQPGCGYVGVAGQIKYSAYASEPWGSVPVYVWGNRVNAPLTYGLINGDSWFQLNRDYFLSPKPGYTEFTYPHPLRGGTPSPPPAQPSPPTNLRIISGQ